MKKKAKNKEKGGAFMPALRVNNEITRSSYKTRSS